MSLSNLNKETTTNLLKMINSENLLNENIIKKIQQDSCTYAQLNLIYNQIENLKIQATKILENHIETNEISNIMCNFKKVPGTLYYLYLDNKDEKIISLVEPTYDSNNNINIIYKMFLGKYLYDYDLSFKKII